MKSKNVECRGEVASSFLEVNVCIEPLVCCNFLLWFDKVFITKKKIMKCLFFFKRCNDVFIFYHIKWVWYPRGTMLMYWDLLYFMLLEFFILVSQFKYGIPFSHFDQYFFCSKYATLVLCDNFTRVLLEFKKDKNHYCSFDYQGYRFLLQLYFPKTLQPLSTLRFIVTKHFTNSRPILNI